MPYASKRKNTYSDVQQAEALTMLISEGYPEFPAALHSTSKALAIPENTLRDWHGKKSGVGIQGTGDAVSSNIHAETKKRYIDTIEAHINKVFKQLDIKLETASYRDLGIVLGILFDKRDRVMGMPTQSIEHRITFDEGEKAQRLATILQAAQVRIPTSTDETVIDSDPPPPPTTSDSIDV